MGLLPWYFGHFSSVPLRAYQNWVGQVPGHTKLSKVTTSFTVKQPSSGSTARRLAEVVRMITTKPIKNT
jgi:hypothetical protein